MFKGLRIYTLLTNKRFQSVVATAFFKAMSSLLFLVAIPFSITHLGESVYGVVAFFLTMHGYVSLLDTGFSYVVGLRYTRALVISESDGNKIISESMPIYIILAVIGLVVFAFLSKEISHAFFGTSAYSLSVALFGLVLALTVVDSIAVVILVAHEMLVRVSFHRFLLDLFKVVGLFVVAGFGLGVDSILIFLILAGVVKLVFDYLCVIKLGVRFCPKINFDEIRLNFLMAWPAITMAGLSLLMSMIDKFLVSGKLSSEAYASYSFAMDLTTRSYFLMYALAGTLYPVFIKKHASGESMKSLLKVWVMALTAIGVFYYLPLGWFAYPIVSFLVDAEFAEKSYALIRVCGLSAIFYLAFNIFENFLNSAGKIKWVMVSYLSGLGVFFLVHAKLMSDYGSYGVAWAVAIMFLTMLITVALTVGYLEKRGYVRG